MVTIFRKSAIFGTECAYFRVVVCNFVGAEMGDGHKKMFYVGDEWGLRFLKTLIRRMDGQSDYELEYASDYYNACEIIEQGVHDVYLIDDCIGKNRGIVIIKKYANRFKHRPFLLLADDPSNISLKEAVTNGAADYLDKNDLDSASFEKILRIHDEIDYALRETLLRLAEVRTEELDWGSYEVFGKREAREDSHRRR